MKLKKLLALLLVLCLLPVSAAFAADTDVTFLVKIGSSSYAIPLSYDFSMVPPDTDEEAMYGIKHYYNQWTDTSFYFHEYNVGLNDYLDYAIANYTGMINEPEDSGYTIDNLIVYFYYTQEQRNRCTLNFVFEENGTAYELEFWFDINDSENQVALIDSLMTGIVKADMTKLGSSSYEIFCPDYNKQDLADKDESLIAGEIYTSEYSDIVFNLFQFENVNGYTAKEYAIAAADGSDVISITSPDSVVYIYGGEAEDGYFISALLEDGKDLVQLVFYCQDENSGYEIFNIINTLQKI